MTPAFRNVRVCKFLILKIVRQDKVESQLFYLLFPNLFLSYLDDSPHILGQRLAGCQRGRECSEGSPVRCLVFGGV